MIPMKHHLFPMIMISKYTKNFSLTNVSWNYFIEGLEAWKTNIDIWLVFYHYKAEKEASEALKQAEREAKFFGKTD